MKKISLFSALALTLVLGACEKYDLPNPPGQAYPQPDGYFENADLALVLPSETLSLTEFNEANKYVPVAEITTLVNFPENYDLVIDMQVGNGAKATIVNTTIDEDMVTVNPDVLNGAIREALTKTPGTYDVPVTFLAYAVRGTTRMGLGGIGATYGTGNITIKTYDASKVIEDAYYVVPVVNGNPDWAKALKMNNTSGNNVSPYDNPEFAVQIEVPADEAYDFVIAPQSSLSAGDAAVIYGGNPAADGMSGKLGTSYNAITMPVFGSVLVTVNMENDAYTINYAFQNIYPLSSGSSITNAMCLYTDNFINYYGVTALNQRFTIYTSLDKKGVIFHLDDSEEPVLSDNELEISGLITASTDAASLIKVPVRGNTLYYMDVNLVQLTYTAKALQTLSVIGSGNGWNLETAAPLKKSSNLKTWTATDVVVGDEFKINANGAWDYDFGGVPVMTSNGTYVYNLQFKGGNMQLPEPGTYDVKVDFSTWPYVLTLTQK